MTTLLVKKNWKHIIYKSICNNIGKCILVIATTFLIFVYMFDFFQDLFIVYYFFEIGKREIALIYLALTIIPKFLSYFLVLYPLFYHVDSSNKRRRLALVLLACFPFLKSCILCWTIRMGWKRWKTRWYLQALTFILLIDAALGEIPQTIILYFIKYENNDLNIDLYNTRDISLVINFVSSLISVFFATKYLNKDEDRRLEHSKRTLTQSHKNTCVSIWRNIAYLLALLFERGIEIFIRIVMFGTFASVVGWNPALYVFIGHLLMFIVLTILCFRKLKQKHIFYENCTKKASFVSSLLVGVVANIFFCHSWSFCHISSRKVVYILYFVLFYATSISLTVSSNVISGSVDNFSIGLYAAIAFQIIFLALCFVFRECKRKRLLQT
ncbi:uncharacterized protein LOC134230150 isoform X2 [Saccostrea cucullata]|uniref:uncharacterized protein LOC134230150 isoform X2 n=1 Tax=Saccostrea cuccullata TaxID=36930 RepID=UPI002ED06508